ESNVAQVQDYFEYKFPFEVRLASRQSALLPFLNRTVKIEKVSIYSKESDAHHPQLGAVLENNSGGPFEPGPVTFFQEGGYAGETVLSYVARGEKKLVGYGVDYDVEINTRDHELPERIVRIKAEKGSLTLEKQTVRTTTYEIRNKSSERRVVLIEHPRGEDVKLSGTSPHETTHDVYRFRVAVNP